MSNKFCIDVEFLILLIASLIVIGIYQYKNNKSLIQSECPVCPSQPEKTITKIIEHDPVKEYDYRKIDDPLSNPARRVPRYEIPLHHLKEYIDIPTRGYPDNFHLFGIVTRIDDTGDNKILKLFGRKIYRGSDKYEYYVTVVNGHDMIKIPVKTKRKYAELYDDDEITIPELDGTYKVKLYDYDAPKYYPDLFY